MNSKSFAALAAAALLAACGGPQKSDPPLAGASIGGPFALTDQDGRTVHDSDFAGKWRIVYFGYTYCPDVCPTDLQNIGKAMKLLDQRDAALARSIIPIFITVDPDRDTPPIMKQYIANFYPRMIGLTGSPAAIAKVAKEYVVYYRKGPVENGGYAVNHTSQAYLMDPQGKPVALLPADQSGEAVAAEIEKWTK